MTTENRRPRILVVDDEPKILHGIRRALRFTKDRWELQFAGSVPEALDVLRSPPLPSLVLCDVLMPGLDGYELLKKLRQDPATRVIPFIFLTGKGENADFRKGMALGADDYLTKPFTTRDLQAAIAMRLEKHDAVFRQADAALYDLRASITSILPHELRTPLAGIIGGSELIVDSCELMETSEIVELAKGIHHSGVRLQRLVENFLLFSQIECVSRDRNATKRLRAYCLDDPGRVITSASLATARSFNREEDLSLDVEDARLGMLDEHLAKVVEEIVANAFSFSDPRSAVHVRSCTNPGVFEVHVTDHGRGMTPEMIAKISAFRQFERSLYEQQGTGLGLIIAKRLSELYGGQLTIESTLQKETTFIISIPLAASLTTCPR